MSETPDESESKPPLYDPNLYHPEYHRKRIQEELSDDYPKLLNAELDCVTMLMVESSPEEMHRQFASIYRHDDIKRWGIGFRCFPDRNTWMMVMGGDWSGIHEIEGVSSVPFLVCADFLQPLSTLNLMAYCFGALKQAQDIETEAYRIAKVNHEPAFLERMTRIACVLDNLHDFMAVEILSEVFELLNNHDFFPLESSEREVSQIPIGNVTMTPTAPAILNPTEPYTISLGSVKNWTEAEGLLTLYPPFVDWYGLIWERMKRSPNTRLFVATSNLQTDDPQQQPTMLGFLASAYPFAEYPTSCYLMAMVVLPDERRRGIATQLLKRFFAHTAISRLYVNFLLDDVHPAYEYARFFQQQGGVVLGHSEVGIQFLIHNPNLQRDTRIVYPYQEKSMPYQIPAKKEKKDTDSDQEV